MRKELDERLCTKYPEIFKDRRGDPQATCMVWGFDCDDGWYDLIDWLCQQLMRDILVLRTQVKRMNEQTDSVDSTRRNELKQRLADAEENMPIAVQVKEKYGGLRFYIANGTDAHWKLIDAAESISYRICEECGSMSGTQLYSMGWYKTLCPTHADIKYGPDAKLFREGKLNLK